MVELINAKKTRETVIEAYKWVAWSFLGHNGESWIIYSDDASIMLIDLNKMMIHCFVLTTYLSHRITKLDRANHNRTLVAIVEMSPPQDTVLAQNMRAEDIGHVLQIATKHPETYRRLSFLLDFLN